MPPKKKQATRNGQSTRRTTRRSTRSNDVVPSVYAEMLAEARSAQDNFSTSPRPPKRRRISPAAEDLAGDVEVSATGAIPSQQLPQTDTVFKPQQTVYDDFEGSEDSDVEFEDIDLEPADDQADLDRNLQHSETLQIDLSKPIARTTQEAVRRRRPVTKAERDFRLDVHKWHLMFLLIHGLERSKWCDDEVVHVSLKQLVSKKTMKLLHVSESEPSYQRNHSFMKGIEEVCALWRSTWNTTIRGLRRAYWREKVDAQKDFDDCEDPIELDDFRSAAHTREGSRDLGAQLFTALLRSLAVDTRLVFSLQVLPFAAVAKSENIENSKSSYILAASQSYETHPSAAHRQRSVDDSTYPIFWTEVLNPATDSWIPLDPLVRNTINKPKTQFEPPASDNLNQMTYVLAFEDDSTVRDVTRRYAQWFNAKTRKTRVESTKNGAIWWDKALRRFHRKLYFPRDELENEYLASRIAAEGMPKNVQDFRGHPVYVLERHIRSNEVIYPWREVGKFSTGSSRHSKVESVYRAQDLHTCRTADAWYRRGRDVKVGEQPLKRAKPKRSQMRGESEDEEEDDIETREGVALYAEFQTSIYEPPPVQKGRIPKNAYGNLDVYVSSMIPAGAVHIDHPLAKEAARTLNIDYAEAVTGFVFKGRQGTAVVSGVVVAIEYTAATVAVIEGLEWLGTQEVQAARSKIILGIWKRMLTALRVHQKIEAEYGEQNEEGSEARGDGTDEDGDSTYTEDQVVEDDGGGFMLEADKTEEKVQEQMISLQALKSNVPVLLPEEVVHRAVKVTRSPHEKPWEQVKGTEQALEDTKMVNVDVDKDLFEDDDGPWEAGGFSKDNNTAVNTTAFDMAAEEGGGFMMDDAVDVAEHDTSEGGGFMTEHDPEDQAANTNNDQPTGRQRDVSPKKASEYRPPTRAQPPPKATNVPFSRPKEYTEQEDSPYTSSTTPIPFQSHAQAKTPHHEPEEAAHDKTTTYSRRSKLPLAPLPSAENGHDAVDINTKITTTTTTTNNTIGDSSDTEIDNDNDNGNDKTSKMEERDGEISPSPLLSHDPDEDDDEPEWLDDALDD